MHLRMFKPKIKEKDLNPFLYDLKGINDRMYKAMMKLGITRVDIARLYGMDERLPLAMQPQKKIPRPTIENVVKLADYMGVSVRWLMYGEPENTVDMFVIGQQITKQNSTPNTAYAETVGASASTGAAIITGTSNSTVIVQNIKKEREESKFEIELLKAFRNLNAKEQILVMSYLFTLEKNTEKELEKQPPA